MADNYQQPTAADADADGNEVPNEVPAQPKSLNIKFTDTSGTEVHFKLKSTTKLKKAMDAYSARIQRDRQALRFLFDGDRVMDDSTPESLEMNDDDTIEVHTEQIGGRGIAEPVADEETKPIRETTIGNIADILGQLNLGGQLTTAEMGGDAVISATHEPMNDINEAPSEPRKLEVTVMDFRSGSEVWFKIKSTIKMERVMKAYAQRIGVELGLLKFWLGGKQVLLNDTAETLAMQDGNTIEVSRAYWA